MLPPMVGKAAVGLTIAVDVARRFQRCIPSWTVGCEGMEVAAVLRELYGDASYWPTPWLDGLLSGHLQTVWYGLNPRVPVYAFTEIAWQTADGGTLGLAWPVAPSTLPDTTPIALVLPGLCGSIAGTGHTTRALFEAGLRPACFHSRGCGVPLTSPCFNLFGSTDDLRDAIGRIAESYPNAPICLYSISAGTALMVRFLGEEGASATIAASVANCPGYDIGVCLSRANSLYDSGFYIRVLRRHWLSGTNGAVLRAASPELFDRLERAGDMHSFMIAASPFARPGGWNSRDVANPGTLANSFADFLSSTNPMGVAHQIVVPGLILNADDDPVCSLLNTEENAPKLLSDGSCRKLVLLRYGRGGHCCFASGWRAKRWADEMSAGFLAALASTEDR